MDHNDSCLLREGELFGFEPRGCGNADFGIRKGIDSLLKPEYSDIGSICVATGDGDFCEYLSKVRVSGKLPIAVSWPDKVSSMLFDVARVILVKEQEVRDYMSREAAEARAFADSNSLSNPVVCSDDADEVYRRILQ